MLHFHGGKHCSTVTRLSSIIVGREPKPTMKFVEATCTSQLCETPVKVLIEPIRHLRHNGLPVSLALVSVNRYIGQYIFLLLILILPRLNFILNRPFGLFALASLPAGLTEVDLGLLRLVTTCNVQLGIVSSVKEQMQATHQLVLLNHKQAKVRSFT